MKNGRSIRWVELHGSKTLMQITHLMDGRMLAEPLVIEEDQARYCKQRAVMKRAMRKEALQIAGLAGFGGYLVREIPLVDKYAELLESTYGKTIREMQAKENSDAKKT
jgi:hypothetical protein